MPLRAFNRSLSARLLVLTIGFVMLAEVLIYTPSIARFREAYFLEKLSTAHLAALTIDAAPDRMVTPELEIALLNHVDAHAIGIFKQDVMTHMLGEEAPRAEASFDLRSTMVMDMIMEAFDTLFQRQPRIIEVIGRSPKDARVVVSVVFDEAPLRREMLGFSKRILALSLVISFITAALVFFSLRLQLVRPMQQITASMTQFRRAPVDTPVFPASRRRDEIGTAMRELAAMQQDLKTALKQKTRLATLGAAVSKVNHDLRNTLATASLVYDTLSRSTDPDVKRVMPTLFRSLDRAVNICTQTLNFTQEHPPVQKEPVNLRLMVEEIVDEIDTGFFPAESIPEIAVDIDPELSVALDPHQFHRVLVNLARNALEAGATRIRFAAQQRPYGTEILIEDNGPGIPETVQATLFKPFAGSTKAAGTGLGLAIAKELVHGHGGTIELAHTGSTGSGFRILLPGAV
ncbi:MAG: HAMP domain-containing histidine kinase [Alphaproteobacteria bacterium]|nr:HAMP domain-containing histidine kinase [Alphaproteobacteria bacterium]